MLSSAHRPLRHLLVSTAVRNASHDALSIVVPPLHTLPKHHKPRRPATPKSGNDGPPRALKAHKKPKNSSSWLYSLSPETRSFLQQAEPRPYKPQSFKKKKKKKAPAGSPPAAAASETAAGTGLVKEKWVQTTWKDHLTPVVPPGTGNAKRKEKSAPSKLKQKLASKDKPRPPHILVPKQEVQGTLVTSEGAVLEDVFPSYERPPIATLSHGLERVLFNPGVHWLQDPRSRVYNFTPWLQTVPKVSDFDFDRIPAFVPSSRDQDLRSLAERENRSFAGSTSSLSGILSHCYFLVSEDKEVDTSILSHDFRNLSKKFSPAQRWPAMVTLNYKDGVHTIDSDKSPFDMPEKTILTWLGTLLERFLTMPQKDFSELLKASPLVTDRRNEREAYRYAKSENFVLRSQLDCYDPRLPGTGVFDIKTRACVPIRLDVLNYEEHKGYTIKKAHGELESFEKEYYDLIRSAFLKYSFQVRIGNMDGVIVAYHNTETLFGFQYIPLSEMDERLFGPGEGVGDKVFEKCVGLMEQVVGEVANCFPGQSSRATFFTKEDTAAMYVWVEPLEWDGEPEQKPIEQLRVEVKSYIGEDPVPGFRAVTNAANPDTPWSMQYKIQRLDVKPDVARKKLTAVQEKILKTYLIPSGIEPENLEEYWQTLGHGTKPESVEGAAAAFDPSLFTAPPQFIQKLRELSRKGKEEKIQMLEKYKDVPVSVLGQST
ncbi:hypothetical protein H1R20_g1925, partial [Candolleomyces eurysporus]